MGGGGARGRARAELRALHAHALAEALLAFCAAAGLPPRALDVAALRAPAPPPAAAAAAAAPALWLRGVAAEMADAQLHEMFDQFGRVRAAAALRCPVTGARTGHAVVRFESAAKADAVADNLDRMIFLPGPATAPPLRAARAAPGPPPGAMGVYDRALAAAGLAESDGGGEAADLDGCALELVEVPDDAGGGAAPAARAATALRAALLRAQLAERDAARVAAAAGARELTELQTRRFAAEHAKLERLRRLLDLPIAAHLAGVHGVRRRPYAARADLRTGG